MTASKIILGLAAWFVLATVCAFALGWAVRRAERQKQEAAANGRRLLMWLETDR
jgi:hypothetical protein